MSRTVFAERFVALLGRTPMQYLAEWRMHLADEMLRARGSSVAQVAERVGYQTEAAFRRAFRRVRGLGRVMCGGERRLLKLIVRYSPFSQAFRRV